MRSTSGAFALALTLVLGAPTLAHAQSAPEPTPEDEPPAALPEAAADAPPEAPDELGDVLAPTEREAEDGGAAPGDATEPAAPPPSLATDSPIPPPPEPTYAYGARVDAERSYEPRIPPERSLGRRYGDALAGSWAATGILVLAVGITGTGTATAVGCIFGGLGCAIGAVIGSMASGGLGWVLGAGVGSARGAGLDAGEGFGVWALGFLTASAIVGVGAAIGAIVSNATGSFNTFGDTMIGIAAASPIAALAQVFLTPLYAVLIYEDREEVVGSPDDVEITPYAAPTPEGFQAGVAAAF